MSLSLEAEQLPLSQDEHGVVRVGGTRVTLNTVTVAFQEGASAEEIALRYPALALADIYAVIGYYLKHQFEVDAYLQGRASQSLEIRRENERRFDLQGVRERLMARRRPKA